MQDISDVNLFDVQPFVDVIDANFITHLCIRDIPINNILPDIGKALINPDSVLVSLKLPGSIKNDLHVGTFLEYVRDSQALSELDISYNNNIGDIADGIENILKHNSTITSLKIQRYAHIGNEHIGLAIVRGLEHNLTMTDIEFDGMQPLTMQRITSMLANNKKRNFKLMVPLTDVLMNLV